MCDIARALTMTLPCVHCVHSRWDLPQRPPPVECCQCGLIQTDAGQVTAAQAAWLTALAGCTGVVSAVWRPSALEAICATLRGR